MLIDVHSHLFEETLNDNRVAEWNHNVIHYSMKSEISQLRVSVLGSWGLNSPIYLPSFEDLVNRRMNGTIIRGAVNMRFLGKKGERS